jgi:hypothetical protein
MIPESGYRFSEKIRLNDNLEGMTVRRKVIPSRRRNVDRSDEKPPGSGAASMHRSAHVAAAAATWAYRARMLATAILPVRR